MSPSSYNYKRGFKPYTLSLNQLSPRVQKIIKMLDKENNMSEIARQVDVSRCFVWKVSHRLKAIQSSL